ncbi:hypothetical protein IAU60_002886 [Kwoniella sp. DSM 27419]
MERAGIPIVLPIGPAFIGCISPAAFATVVAGNDDDPTATTPHFEPSGAACASFYLKSQFDFDGCYPQRNPAPPALGTTHVRTIPQCLNYCVTGLNLLSDSLQFQLEPATGTGSASFRCQCYLALEQNTGLMEACSLTSVRQYLYKGLGGGVHL